MKHRYDHAAADRACTGGDDTDSSTSPEEAGFPLGEGGCTQPTDQGAILTKGQEGPKSSVYGHQRDNLHQESLCPRGGNSQLARPKPVCLLRPRWWVHVRYLPRKFMRNVFSMRLTSECSTPARSANSCHCATAPTISSIAWFALLDFSPTFEAKTMRSP